MSVSSIALKFAFVIRTLRSLKPMLKHYNVDSIEIACWVNRDSFDPDKRNLLFIHGSGGNHSIWSHQYGRLHKKYNIIAVNLPGHGPSGGSGEHTIERYCLWIKDIVDVLHLNKVVLVGHSLGAAIALQSAINYPEKIEGIVCIGAGEKMPVNSFFLEFLQTNPPQIPAEIIDLICKFSLAKENRPKFISPLGKSIAMSKVDVMYGDLAACNNLDLTGQTDKIKVPALIVCGDEDKMTPHDLSRDLAAHIKRAKLETLAGAGHMAMIEKPAEFNETLDKFVRSI